MKMKIGFAVLGLAALAAAPATAGPSRVMAGEACNYITDPSAAHTLVNGRFNNTSGGARLVTCPIVTEHDVHLTYGALDFKTPMSSLKVVLRKEDGSVGWADPDREIYLKPDGSLRRGEWFISSDYQSEGGGLAFEGVLGDDAFVLRYQLNQ